MVVTDPKGQITLLTYKYGHQLLSRSLDATGRAVPVVPLASAVKGFNDITFNPPPSGFSFLYAGGICVTNGAGQCIGGDAVKETGIGSVIGYIKDTGGSGTVPVYASTCYSNAGGACFGRGLSLDVNGAPSGYLSTTAPDTQSAAAPFTQSNGLLLQSLGGTPSAYLWSASTNSTAKTDHFYSNDYSQPVGYAEEGIIGFLRKDSASGTVALNRYRNAATGLHYYSTVADQPPGYTLHGTIGYLDSAAGTGLIALRRFYNASTGDYRIDILSTPPSGYVLQATLGYLQVTNSFTTYVRNPIGQVTSASTLDVTYNYTFDAAHRVTSVNDSRGNKTISYSYSAAGRRLMMQDSNGNRTDYNYDPTGRLTQIWAPNNDTVTFAYDDGGRLKEKWLPNGVNTQYTYNADNTLQQLVNRHGSGSIISQHDYTYDDLGNRQTHSENIAGATTPYKYVYDELNRLTEVRNNNGNALIESYSYGAVGNRISSQSTAFGGQTVYYNHDAANQLTDIRIGSSSGPVLVAGFVYDENGNLTKKCEGGTVTASSTTCSGSTITDLVHDFLNRPVQIAKTGIATQTYKYDDSGRRIQKVAGSAITNFIHDGWNIASEFDGNWINPVAVYTHGPGLDNPLIRITGATAKYYHQDGVGSVVAVTDLSGVIDAIARYDTYGNNLNGGVGTIAQYGYTGREPDETGLMYYRARYYDPMVGRFTQRDPIGLAGGVNSYAYVGNNPTGFRDPMGLLAETAAGNLRTQETSYFGQPLDSSLSEASQESLSAAKQSLAVNGIGSSDNEFQTSQTSFEGSSIEEMVEMANVLGGSSLVGDSSDDEFRIILTGAEDGGSGGTIGRSLAGAAKGFIQYVSPAAAVAAGYSATVVREFTGIMQRVSLPVDITVYRYIGGTSPDPRGHWLTTQSTVNMINSLGIHATEALNLPKGATAESLVKWVIPANTEFLVGGIQKGAAWATQIWISNTAALINMTTMY